MKLLNKKLVLNRIIKTLKQKYLDIEKAEFRFAEYKLITISKTGFHEKLIEPDKLIIEFKSIPERIRP